MKKRARIDGHFLFGFKSSGRFSNWVLSRDASFFQPWDIFLSDDQEICKTAASPKTQEL